MPYGNQDGPSMESAKQEKYDLLHDNPVAKDASGGRPWIAKHFKSSMSPLKDGHEGGPEMKEGMHMNYYGVSKKYPAAGHKNLMEDAGAAPKMHTPFHKAGPGDLDGDGEMSDYEANRQKKIEEAMAKKNKK